jgi:FixJ family two-component response regulator
MIDVPTVHLVDDDASFLTAMTRLLRASGFCVSPWVSPVAFLDEMSPHARGCAVIDLEMPQLDGFEVQSALARTGISMPVIFLTGHGDVPSTVRAMRGGASDFLEKCAAKDEMLAAITAALDRDAAQHAERQRARELNSRFGRLTQREREVLHYVVLGKMNKEIAATLGINERTVKLHRTAITTKVGVHSVAQLALLTQESGLLQPKTGSFP